MTQELSLTIHRTLEHCDMGTSTAEAYVPLFPVYLQGNFGHLTVLR